jgi:hypothetical protein
MRLRYLNRKHIKTNYETQFSTDQMLNDEVEKKIQLKKRYKKQPELTQVNLLT